MKLGIAWFAVLGLCIVVSCSVNHRSGDYACTKQSDCSSPRVCEQGFCIVPNGVPIDGPPGPPTDGKAVVDGSMNQCPSQCTSCDPNAHTCKIECGASNNDCNAEVVCPPGYACDITCNTPSACRNGVVCTDAKACTIICGGSNSCHNIMCGDGPCQLSCTGSGSCKGVDCGNSCACDVACAPGSGTSQPCQNVICSGFTCDNSPGCTSQTPGCNTCVP